MTTRPHLPSSRHSSYYATIPQRDIPQSPAPSMDSVRSSMASYTTPRDWDALYDEQRRLLEEQHDLHEWLLIQCEVLQKEYFALFNAGKRKEAAEVLDRLKKQKKDVDETLAQGKKELKRICEEIRKM